MGALAPATSSGGEAGEVPVVNVLSSDESSVVGPDAADAWPQPDMVTLVVRMCLAGALDVGVRHAGMRTCHQRDDDADGWDWGALAGEAGLGALPRRSCVCACPRLASDGDDDDGVGDGDVDDDDDGDDGRPRVHARWVCRSVSSADKRSGPPHRGDGAGKCNGKGGRTPLGWQALSALCMSLSFPLAAPSTAASGCSEKDARGSRGHEHEHELGKGHCRNEPEIEPEPERDEAETLTDRPATNAG